MKKNRFKKVVKTSEWISKMCCYYYYYYYFIIVVFYRCYCHYYYLFSFKSFFYTSVWVTTSLLKSPGFFSVFWLISIMQKFEWSPLFLLFPSPLVPLLILWCLPRAPITIGIIFTFIFHRFFNPQARSRYLSLFSNSFNFTLSSTRTEKSTILEVFFFLLIIIYSFWVFHISISWWFFSGVSVTASLLKSLGLFSVFWPFSFLFTYHYGCKKSFLFWWKAFPYAYNILVKCFLQTTWSRIIIKYCY